MTTRATKSKGTNEDIAPQFLLDTSDLLTRFADYNPRIHEEDDIKATALSLLEVGWATSICINSLTGKIVGGHARSLSADWLRNQDREWFDLKWEEWLEANPQRGKLASHHKKRFNPGFWNQCPCIEVELDLLTEKATNIRLNSTAREGKNDPAKVAALLAQLPESLQDHASFDKKEAQSYIDAYLVRQEVQSEEPPEVQLKQFFERPDAIVRNKDGEILSIDEIASNPVEEGWTVEVDGQIYTEEEAIASLAEEGEQEIALDDWDLDDIDPDSFRGASVDKDIAETRIVLLVSRNELEEFMEKIGTCAELLGVEATGSAKVWRPKTVMALVRQVYAQAPPKIEV